MSSVVPSASSTPAKAARARHPVASLPVIGAALACAALAAALIAGPGGHRLPISILAIAAAGVLAAEVVRRAVRLGRRLSGPMWALANLVLLVAVALVWLASAAHLEFLAIAALLAVVAGGLIGWGLTEARATRGRIVNPWSALRGPSRNQAARAILGIAGPALVGVILGLAALRFVLGLSVGWVTLVLAVGAVACYAVVHLRGTPDSKRPAVVADQVAAHLHDSVLQTLALIQRTANDPARVAQLARQQERSLRDWLAGRDGTSAVTLSGAIRTAAAEVEGEIAGATIEVVCVGDRPIDRRSQMLVNAAREAMRNAVRHGGTAVRVFAETESAATTVFVRDTGSGFALDQVPDDRRGVRDAIIGRMEHVGGSATIHSGTDGTEVEMVLPADPS